MPQPALQPEYKVLLPELPALPELLLELPVHWVQQGLPEH
jgi:hypothetical protein